MKMTQLLWRIVSVWLCVAVICRYPSCNVGCTETRPESQRPKSSEGVSSEEETEEKTHHQQNEESWALSAQSLSENEQLTEDGRPEVEQITQDVDKKQRSEAFEVEEPVEEVELEPDRILQPEESSQYQHPETSISQDPESAPLQLSPDSVDSAANKDDPSVPNLQEEVPNSISSGASDLPTTEVIASNLPPADCMEEEDNPYDGGSPPLVLDNTSNAHTTGTKTHSDPPLSPPAVHDTKYLEANTSHMLKEQDLSSPVAADTDPSASSKDPEDIPTFDEWKRKMMEVEKEKTLSTHISNNGGSNTVKKVQKNFNNYASVECGAKILGANPEAKSTSSILKENMDLYMLNPCSNKIWFIIELCEPIQVKQLDIANFELFSSTPKDFLVSISDRYPTNKWLKLGTFHARDERTVQSFPLDEHLYAKYVKMFTKYIKVELVSHFGTEHFCPLSLIRVFGTSMVEEYEEIADPSERPDDLDDDLDYPSGTAPGEVKSSKNLIGSAKDAILNIVNVAVNALGGNSEMNGNVSSQEVNMTEPSQQLETTSETVTTDLPTDPDSEDVQALQESAVPPTEVPSLEIPSLEPTTTDDDEQQLPPVEEKIVIPLEKDEEEPISSTITLLEKEDELDEGKEKKVHQERHKENLKYCRSFASLSSSCSCTPSLQEYVQQQCSALLSTKRKCQTMDVKPNISPIQTLLPPPPSALPEPQSDGGEEKEQIAELEPDSEVISEELQPAENSEESISEPVVLEPSQTLNLPSPSAIESSFAKLTPTEETPQLSSEEPGPENSQDVLAEEKHIEPSAILSSSTHDKPSVSVSVEDSSEVPTQEKPNVDEPEVNTPIQIQDQTDQSLLLLPTSSYSEHQAVPPVVPESGPTPTEASHPAPDTVAESEPPVAVTDMKMEDLSEDPSTSSGSNGQLLFTSSPTPSSPTSSSLLDIYAEPFNVTEQNGNQVHGSSQKESVFMRLNNRIKALEVNMSLSGRYLEQLSQRYRKQMEEMQRAFNKTIIKLQNTSRIAEEQDLRQTESIQLLQGQLENVTQLVLNLSVRVSQLQNEVSDRQNYLLLSLGLCLCLGLLLCVNHCRITIPPTIEPEPPIPKSYTFCCPERQFSSCDETGLKRSSSYPLIHSDSFQLATTEGPEMHEEETQSLCAANRKRRRRKVKPMDKVETLKPSFQGAPELSNGAVCNGVAITANPTLLTKQVLQPSFRHSPSEGSSEGSSHSDDPSFCGITAACSRICDGLPPPKTRAEKRALRRRRPKPSSAGVDLLRAPQRNNIEPLPITIQDILKRKTEQNSSTFMALAGPV
ncbi:SUN domain-containing ossification factor-like isoform X2 [Melanotaenia boesemani]|uniref:SUN domain-containing ossification factor-like isoform X2 n=1 Tax=Melanotaenia boesemani TaxID=1250792 RepID=UPI001C042EDF|nr:SUN domain-containing ossification factor-like isoform X2 [Melanotaenia boesemani]